MNLGRRVKASLPCSKRRPPFLAKVGIPALLVWPTLSPIQGRRGLLNLGQTCFLNVILQCFIHNPLLRNYFLGDRHNTRLCKHTDCTCCEMDNLFAEVGDLPNLANSIRDLTATSLVSPFF